MNKTIKGLHCKPGLPLTKILKKWISLITEIAEAWLKEKDVPWWYNERAALSIFAGAVWRSGNVVFEEFVDEKRNVSQKTGKLSSNYKGRIDMYFKIDSIEFIVEAKQCYSGASSLNVQSSRKISEHLSKACGDIRRIKPHGQRRLAFLFVVPDVRKGYAKYLNAHIKNWLVKIQLIDCDAIAWVFPSVARKTKWKNFYYPGVVLMIKEI